jgi:hypothetical protein
MRFGQMPFSGEQVMKEDRWRVTEIEDCMHYGEVTAVHEEAQNCRVTLTVNQAVIQKLYSLRAIQPWVTLRQLRGLDPIPE